MNAVVPIDRADVVHVPTVVAPALMPTDMRSAMELAAFMAKAKLVPAALQGSPGDCLLVIEQAMRWEMSPFAVAQEVSVISGKLMYSGKLVAGVVNARGPKHGLTGRLQFEYSGEGDNRRVRVFGQINGRMEEIFVRLGDVRTNNAQWTKQPDQQLAYHGARVWARRHMPELMLGIWTPEEFPEPAPRDEALSPPHRQPPLDPNTTNFGGEVEERTVDAAEVTKVHDEHTAERERAEFADRLNAAIGECATGDDLEALWREPWVQNGSMPRQAKISLFAARRQAIEAPARRGPAIEMRGGGRYINDRDEFMRRVRAELAKGADPADVEARAHDALQTLAEVDRARFEALWRDIRDAQHGADDGDGDRNPMQAGWT